MSRKLNSLLHTTQKKLSPKPQPQQVTVTTLKPKVYFSIQFSRCVQRWEVARYQVRIGKSTELQLLMPVPIDSADDNLSVKSCKEHAII